MLHFRCANRFGALPIFSFLRYVHLNTGIVMNVREVERKKIENWHKGQAEKWNECRRTIRNYDKTWAPCRTHTHTIDAGNRKEKGGEVKKVNHPNQTKPNANLNCKSCLWCVIQMVGRTFRRLLLCADVCLRALHSRLCASEWMSGRAKKLLFLNGSEIRFSIPF